MSCIIHIETSTKVCSVALSQGEKLLFNRENHSGSSHAEMSGVFVQDAVAFARVNKLKIDAVAVSAGPGSYTGLRIGISEAKGFCYGANLPLIAIPSLEILAQGAIGSGYEVDYYCPMIDARRMEVYSAIYDRNLNPIREVAPDTIDEHSFATYLSKGKVLFFGDGADKCKSMLTSPNALFLTGVYPLASQMLTLAEEKYRKKDFVNVAYFEPFYLKDFMATQAKNKVININNEI